MYLIFRRQALPVTTAENYTGYRNSVYNSNVVLLLMMMPPNADSCQFMRLLQLPYATRLDSADRLILSGVKVEFYGS
jgi:hypothetical protein